MTTKLPEYFVKEPTVYDNVVIATINLTSLAKSLYIDTDRLVNILRPVTENLENRNGMDDIRWNEPVIQSTVVLFPPNVEYTGNSFITVMFYSDACDKSIEQKNLRASNDSDYTLDIEDVDFELYLVLNKLLQESMMWSDDEPDTDSK